MTEVRYQLIPVRLNPSLLDLLSFYEIDQIRP